jgi:putative ABC transport system permease protein
MQVPLLKGRDIADTDQRGSAPIVVINEAAATRFFSSEDPLGRQLGYFSYDPIEEAAETFTIVGIVANVRSLGLREAPTPEAYFSHAQVSLAEMFIVIRTVGDPRAQANAFRADVKALDPNLPIRAVQTLDQVMATSLDRDRFFTSLLGLFSGVALTLATVGIFGLLSFAVARRTREIAVRKALGASPITLVTRIAREALVLVALGLAIGLGGALMSMRLLEQELFNVAPTDPITFASVSLVLAATALIASLVPGWRAAAVDPAVALRAE